MSSAKDKFSSKGRKSSQRSYRSLFAIVVEGETEEKYFTQDLFNSINIRIQVVVGKPNDPLSLANSADGLLEKLKGNGSLRAGDQAWVVLDRDNWEPYQLEALKRWAQNRRDRFIGFSDPQFEYWILLHYEVCSGIRTKRECLERLSHFDRNYQKNTSFSFTREQIFKAIKNGESKYRQLPKDFNLFDYMEDSHVAFTNLHQLTNGLLSVAR